MNYRITFEPLFQLTFDIVDGIVQHQNIALSRHFRVQRNHHPAGTVIVHNQVVHSLHLRMSHHNLFDLLNKGFFRFLAQQRADGIPGRADTGIKNKERHQYAAPTVDHRTGALRNHSCAQHRQRGYSVAETVQRSGFHGCGIDFFAYAVVVEVHIHFYTNGDH